MSIARHIDFEAIENFRDFGGYATACGRGVVSGRLFRSGHHHFATEADLAQLKALGVAAIVDLRNPMERAREPGRRWAGFDGEIIENDMVPDSGDWADIMRASPLTGEWWYENTREHYQRNVFEPRHLDLFRRLFAAIAAGRTVVVHCAAGKDRTGIACALVQHAAGVHHDDILSDFLLTNDPDRLERKMMQAGDFVERVAGRRPSDEALRVAVQVFPEYLDVAFGAIRADHGSVDAYLEAVLGVDGAARARIHEQILG